MLATMSESVREWAWNSGHLSPDHAWLLHDYDVWTSNPHYSGPAVPHPDDDSQFEYGPWEAPKEADFDDIPF
jgi:hypothetical protein